MKSIVKNFSQFINESHHEKNEEATSHVIELLKMVKLDKYIDRDSIESVDLDDSTTEYNVKLKIYKDSHNFPDDVSNDLEKKTRDIDELTYYLTDTIETGELLNYSNHGRSKLYTKTEIEYIGEEGSDYVFLVKIKSGRE
jgi:hypothetical protein